LDRSLLLEALALIVALRVALCVLPFTTVRRYVGRWADGGRGNATLQANRIVWAVNAMGRRVPGTTCLVEALAAHTMLRRYGQTPLLKIGVRRGAVMSLDAHAWVECGGTVVIGTTPSLAEYAVLS
jgi:hypothetical protein